MAGLLKHESERDWPADLQPRPSSPCLEAQVVDLSDSTAYNKHDLEDGLLAGMFTEEDLRAESALCAAPRQPSRLVTPASSRRPTTSSSASHA